MKKTSITAIAIAAALNLSACVPTIPADQRPEEIRAEEGQAPSRSVERGSKPDQPTPVGKAPPDSEFSDCCSPTGPTLN